MHGAGEEDQPARRAAAVPPDDHLVALLRGGSRAGEGGYNAVDAWWTALRDDGGSDATADRLVTVHEAFHATLNDCTGFGIGLAATGVLARFRGNDTAVRRLVNMCRTVHEAYATFTSLWAVSAGDLALLGDRADYLGWYRDAADLLPLPPGARRAQLVLDEAARVCMQSAALPDLLATGLDAPLLEVAPADRPDVRFGWLHESADADFWTSTWGRCAEVAGALPGWETLLAADSDPAALELTYSDEIAPTCATVGEVIYAQFAALLHRRGARTLGYDEHQGLAVDTIANLERLVPKATGVLRPALQSDSTTLESFEVWSRERLSVRDAPRPARLHRIEDRPSVGLLSDFRGKNHVFCIARPAFRLRRQFTFDAADDVFLADLQDQPVLTVVSAGTDLVDLIVLSRPPHLTAINHARPGELSVLVNVTLSCLGDIDWRDRWAPALHHTGVTALIDLVPLRQFEAWRNEGSSLRYALGTIRGGTAGASVFVAELDDGGLRLILPCTHVTADVMAEYLTRHYPSSQQTESVFDGVQELIEITMSHLMSIEHSFDVTAYYEPPGGIRHAGPRRPSSRAPCAAAEMVQPSPPMTSTASGGSGSTTLTAAAADATPSCGYCGRPTPAPTRMASSASVSAVGRSTSAKRQCRPVWSAPSSAASLDAAAPESATKTPTPSHSPPPPRRNSASPSADELRSRPHDMGGCQSRSELRPAHSPRGRDRRWCLTPS